MGNKITMGDAGIPIIYACFLLYMSLVSLVYCGNTNFTVHFEFDVIRIYLLHLLSSDPSAQSYAPSQTLFLEMQSPFAQVASYKPQAVGGRNVGRGSPVKER